MLKKLNLGKEEKITFKIHFVYSIIEGIIAGVLALNEFVLIKSLKGTDYQIGILFQLSVIVLIISIVFNELLKNFKNKKKLLRIIGIITRMPLVLLIFFPKDMAILANSSTYQIFFLAVFLIYFLANPFIFPTINLFLKNSYQHSNFGKLYSWSTTANKVVMLVATLLFGILLDYDNYAYVYVYPSLAVLGIISIFLLSRIKFKSNEDVIKKQSIKYSIIDSGKNMLRIIKTNKPYRDFEIGFMLYGFAWMTTVAVITIFFDKVLHLNYSSVAFYKNSYNIIAIFLLPVFGKLIGKIDPRKFAIYTFLFLLLHLFFLALTQFFSFNFEFLGIKVYYSLIVAYISYGLFAATMALLWFIGSAYFCKDKEAAHYQSIHLTLTGVRGLFAPLLGVLFYKLIGFTGAFLIGILFLAIAMFIMYLSMKRDKIK
ncbi:MFS transporter [Bacteroidota bacterium]